MTNENNESIDQETLILRESLKQRLETEIGIPLTPKTIKQVEYDFNNTIILTDYYPISDINQLKINNVTISDYDLVNDEGIIYLDKKYTGKLILEYTYCLNESEYKPILDLMESYELDTDLTKNASSIKEKDVTISYNTDLSKGAIIQSMISKLQNKYNCIVRMI